jgi:hypothetical protein
LINRKLLAATILAGGLGLASGSASAMLPVHPGSPAIKTGNFVPVATTVVKKKVVRKKNGRVVTTTTTKRWAYNRGRHGQRYRARRAGYRYYYGGYYYAQPWWTIAPGLSISIN